MKFWKTGKLVFDQETARIYLEDESGYRTFVPDSATARLVSSPKERRFIRKVFRDPNHLIRGRNPVLKEVEILVGEKEGKVLTGELYFAKDFYVKQQQADLKYEYHPMILIVDDKENPIIPIPVGTRVEVLFSDEKLIKETDHGNIICLASRKDSKQNVKHNLFARRVGSKTEINVWVESVDLTSLDPVISFFDSFPESEFSKFTRATLDRILRVAHSEYLEGLKDES